MSSTKYTYTWKIPAITSIQKDLLCNGFTRLNYKNFIMQPIIDLFSCYLTKDKYTLNNIKNGIDKQYFCSPIFTLQSFKWYLKLTLNKDKNTNEKQVHASLNLASNPPNISSIQTEYKLCLIETDTQFSNSFIFAPFISTYQIGTLQLDQLMDFTQLTFVLQLNVIRLRNQSGHTIQNHQGLITIREYMESDTSNTSNECPLIQYKWNAHRNISKLEKKYSIRSPIFTANSLKFFLELGVNDSTSNSNDSMTLSLYLVSLTPKLSLICAKCKLFIAETDLEYIFMHNFQKRNMIVSKTVPFINTNQMTILLEMIIFDLYGKHGQTIGIENYFHKKIFNQTVVPSPSVNTYKWNIRDKQLMPKIKNAPNMEEIASKPFRMCGLIWDILISPDGCSAQTVGNVSLFLHLLSLPPKISQITVCVSFYIEEIELHRQWISEFVEYNNVWGWDKMCSNQRIKSLNELTIRVETKILNYFDTNGNLMSDYVPGNTSKQINLSSEIIYEWKISKSKKMNEIKNAKKGQTFYSNYFKTENAFKKENEKLNKEFKEKSNKKLKEKLKGDLNEKSLKWRLNLSNNKKKEYVSVLLQLVNQLWKLQKIVVKFELFLKEINVKCICCGRFGPQGLLWGKRKICKSEAIENLNELTVIVKMVLLDVYDSKGDLINDYVYDKKNKKLKHIYRNIWIKNEKLSHFELRLKHERREENKYNNCRVICANMNFKQYPKCILNTYLDWNTCFQNLNEIESNTKNENNEIKYVALNEAQITFDEHENSEWKFLENYEYPIVFGKSTKKKKPTQNKASSLQWTFE